MAVEPANWKLLATRLRLAPFRAELAATVASWAAPGVESFWWAPHTAPPVTPEKVRRWSAPGHEQLVLVRREVAGDAAAGSVEVGASDVVATDGDAPLAYGELNPLNAARGEYWLGHLIVDPRRRGEGLGKAAAHLLLRRAFQRLGARRVTLVVFPENRTAIASYAAVGFRPDGSEAHRFPAYGRAESLLRMTATGAG